MELVLMPRVLAENKTDQYQFSIFKEDLKVGIELTGHRGDPERAETIFKSADVSTRILFCPQREKTCRPVFLAHLPFVAYSHYKLGVRILNADDLYRDKLLNDYIKVEVSHSEIHTLGGVFVCVFRADQFGSISFGCCTVPLFFI